MNRGVEFRPSTLGERKEFYEKEFSISKARKWFAGRPLPQLCALDPGSDTGIIKNKKLAGAMYYFPFKDLKKKIKQYLPEDLYYDRNTYDNPKKFLKTLNFRGKDRRGILSQELVFDIDAENIRCNHPRNQPVCEKCLNKAHKWALKMSKELGKRFKKIKLVYSGRGFHVHVLDEEARRLTIKQREAINRQFSDYPIDAWVSRGYINLIRMPFSLNGLVSRTTTPLKGAEFNVRKTHPRFLKF